MAEKIYIHYGSNKFDPKLIFSPHNPGDLYIKNKPVNALWASDVEADLGWKDWCTREEFYTDRLDKSFRFKLKDDAKVLYIDSLEKEELIPIREGSYWTGICAVERPYDFDKLVEMGIDAVEVSISSCHDLYNQIYGWDCDSIAILNPDVIEVIDNEEL